MSYLRWTPIEQERYLNEPGFHACVESIRAALRFGLKRYDIARCADIAFALELARVDEIQRTLMAEAGIGADQPAEGEVKK